MFRRYAVLGALNALLAVALGAFGAHVLKGVLDDRMMSAYETGVHYHLVHALGLLFLALAADKLGDSAWARRSGALLAAGILLFSGSLYAMSLSGIGALGIITPFGGVSFLSGWACLALAAWKK